MGRTPSPSTATVLHPFLTLDADMHPDPFYNYVLHNAGCRWPAGPGTGMGPGLDHPLVASPRISAQAETMEGLGFPNKQEVYSLCCL